MVKESSTLPAFIIAATAALVPGSPVVTLVTWMLASGGPDGPTGPAGPAGMESIVSLSALSWARMTAASSGSPSVGLVGSNIYDLRFAIGDCSAGLDFSNFEI
jgi:hypothetical protein